MLTRLPATKIGMTQIFDKDRRAVPVTVVSFAHWFVTQIKTSEADGYDALQLGRLKKRYEGMPFSKTWLLGKKRYFNSVREVRITDQEHLTSFALGQPVSLENISLAEGESVAVSGVSRGLGFQGVVKRWNFGGGPKTHGSTFHRAPGSIGSLCSQGKVVKGKRLPGHAGGKRVTVQGLQVIRLDKETGCLFIKGSVPGKKNSLLFISKQG